VSGMRGNMGAMIFLLILMLTAGIVVSRSYLMPRGGDVQMMGKRGGMVVLGQLSGRNIVGISSSVVLYGTHGSVETSEKLGNPEDSRPGFVWDVVPRVRSISGSPPPSSGDWIINDTTVVSDSILIINGSIIVNETGTLVLINTSIYMNLSFDGEHNIEVYGNFTVLNSSITAYNTSNNYRIISYDGSRLRIEDSEISYAGYAFGLGYAGVLIKGNNATIRNSLVRYCYFGIYLDSSNYSVIYGNTIVNNTCTGIYMGGSYYVTVFNNTIMHTHGDAYYEGYGIYCVSCRYNNISQNTIRDNRGWGLYLRWSYYNKILDNIFVRDGMYVETALYNTVVNNIVNGKPLVYLEGKYNTVVDTPAGEVILINCRNVRIRNQNITNTDVAILVWNSEGIIANSTIRNNYIYGIYVYGPNHNSTIYGSTIENNREGIYILSGWVNVSNNTITNDCIYVFSGAYIANNTIIMGNPYGIYLSYVIDTTIRDNIIQNTTIGMYILGSDRVDILGNTLKNDTKAIYLDKSNNITVSHNKISDGAYGIYLRLSGNITISQNTLENNKDAGVWLYSSNNVTVFKNTINGSMIGIELWDSNRNNITGNTVIGCLDSGIFLNNSNNNTVYLNNFIDNINQYNVSGGSGNRFYSPHPITYTFSGKQYTNYTGNYWSDYTGNDTNFDGIGDEPYGMDYYPLVGVVRIIDGYVEILTDAPQVIIISPTNNTATNETTVVIKWNGSDPTYDLDHYEIYVNGTPENTSIPSTVVEYTLTLSEGLHIITVRAVDEEGNIGIDKVYIVVDITPPSLEILSPQNNSNLNDSTITISWECSDTLAGVDHYEIYVDGVPIDTNISSTQTEYPLTLNDGSHIIILKAVDRAGNAARQTLEVTIDATPPIIEILSPSTNSFFNTTTIMIYWNASDTFSGIDHYELYVDNEPLDVSIPSTITSYTVTLDEGVHIVTIRAIDGFGNIGEDSVRLTIDITPPIVEITSPQNGSIFNTTVVEIYWDGQDDLSRIDHYELYVDGEPIDTQIPYIFISYAITLDEGTNSITIRAVDKAGNVGEDTIWIVVDITLPRLEITVPMNNTALNTTIVVVSWRGEDSLSGIDHYELYVDGVLINMNIPLGHEQYEVELDEGTHIIVVKAIDRAGNVGSSTLNITIDITPPTVEIILPENNTTLNTTTITLWWDAYDYLSGIEHFEVYVNGNPINVTIPPTQTKYTITLHEGRNIITIVAVDRAGNRGISTVILNVKTPHPCLLYLIILTVVVVAIALVIFWRKKRSQVS